MCATGFDKCHLVIDKDEGKSGWQGVGAAMAAVWLLCCSYQYCHQSGGTDVVDLPDILLPAGQYLDMFDSESETDLPGTSSDEELVEV